MMGCTIRSRSVPRRAFTLVEAVATITIIAIIAGASSRLIFAGADGYASAATRAELANAASAAMERIALELREVAARPASSPVEPHLDSVTASSISWEGGVSLALSGSEVILTTGGVGRTLVADVGSFAIQCFDESGTPLASTLSGDACDAVRRIQITLTLTRSGVSETLRTRVFLRCMIAGGGS